MIEIALTNVEIKRLDRVHRGLYEDTCVLQGYSENDAIFYLNFSEEELVKLYYKVKDQCEAGGLL